MKSPLFACSQVNRRKTQLNRKIGSPAAAESRIPLIRSGLKTTVHRSEGRKLREQLRRLDWELAGMD